MHDPSSFPLTSLVGQDRFLMTDHHSEMQIDASLVRRLVAAQFPEWKELSVCPIYPGGWDNRTFRLGEQMLVRMPSAAHYAMQVEKEHRWLPRLAPLLPLPIPIPLAMGEPAESYPWHWSIYGWLEGEPATTGSITDLRRFAIQLAQFLQALQRIDAAGGPAVGPHNFYRGGPLTTYDGETGAAIKTLRSKIDTEAVTAVWEAALTATWRGSPVWVHGDVSPGNLLVKEGRLSAVIDFGCLGVGDPACDLAMAWTFFDGSSREAFVTTLSLDKATWARARGWTLWKALIIWAGLPGTNPADSDKSERIINDLVADHRATA